MRMIELKSTVSSFARKGATRKVKTERAMKDYEKSPWFSTRGWFTGYDETALEHPLRRAERLIRFMDCTGLTPSRAWVRIFGGYSSPHCFDHTLVWHRGKEYAVTTEPYGSAKEIFTWCMDEKWTVFRYPGLGIWAPPATSMCLMAPPKNGVNLFDIANDLKGVMEEFPLEKSG